MSDPGRLDSAAALARSPLFSHLGRLDLARLAGELEEMHFTPGQAIVRQGDRPDGFYVIKQGRAAVLDDGASAPGPATEPRDQPLTTLGPGEVFGEMALLTESPRTATVVAETDLTVWRLSRSRFETLLDHERGIARSIERSLSHRLAAMNHETGALRALGHRLAAAALGRLSPGAVRLVANVAARPRWTAETLRRTCARTGDDGALTELVGQSGLLRLEGAELVVDPTFLAIAGRTPGSPIPPGCARRPRSWRRTATSSRPRTWRSPRGRSRTPSGSSARTRRACSRPRPPETSTAGSRRSASGRPRSAPGSARCDAARRADGAPAPGGGARKPRADGAALRAARPGLATVRALSALAAVVAFGLGWLLPLPEGLTRGGLVTLGAIVATVPLLVANVLPDYIVMLFLILALVLPGLVPPSDILGGFAAPAWLMIFTLLAVGVAVSRSGLMFRLVLLSLQRLPPRFVPQSLVLCLTGVLMSAGLTSGSTRIALGVPIARGITDAMGFAPRSPGAAAVGLMTFFTFLQMGELFQTGTFTGLVVHDLLPPAARSEITWWRWFFVALPPFVFIGAATYLSLLFLFKPHRDGRVNLEAVRLQQALLGPLTPERDLERGGAGRSSSPASRRGRITGSPPRGWPWARSCSCSRSARSTSRRFRAAGRSASSSTRA